jgi:hypothetical protein
MVKRRLSIKYWSSIYGTPAVISKMTGRNFCHLPSMLSIPQLRKLPKCHRFLQTMVFNLRHNGARPKEGTEWTNPASEILLSHWKAIWENLRANIKTAQEKNARYYDRKVMTPPDFTVGDLVMIDARNMRQKDHPRNLIIRKLVRLGFKANRDSSNGTTHDNRSP